MKKYIKPHTETYGKDFGSIAGNRQYDAARTNWGGTWRLPTAGEIDELINGCQREWKTQGGHNGYKVTGPNGNSIFLPATGERCGPGMALTASEYGYYWGATPSESNSTNAYFLFFGGGKFFRGGIERHCGHSVRPVSK